MRYTLTTKIYLINVHVMGNESAGTSPSIHHVYDTVRESSLLNELSKSKMIKVTILYPLDPSTRTLEQ